MVGQLNQIKASPGKDSLAKVSLACPKVTYWTLLRTGMSALRSSLDFAKPLKRLDIAPSLLHRAKAPVLMRDFINAIRLRLCAMRLSLCFSLCLAIPHL